MAYTTRSHGDFNPVSNFDARSYTTGTVNAATSALTVQPQGPKLDFFQITMANTMATQQGVNGYVSNVLQAIQQTSTVAMYQVDADQISFAVYPTGAFANASVFLAAANITYTGYQLDSAASVGFKLATS